MHKQGYIKHSELPYLPLQWWVLFLVSWMKIGGIEINVKIHINSGDIERVQIFDIILPIFKWHTVYIRSVC